MLFVGIDVASKKRDIAITSSEGDIVVLPFTISNDLKGFKKLPIIITSYTESFEDVRIGIEEIGIYSKNISEFLALHGIIVHMINPVLTNHSRKSQSLLPAKTYKIDAFAICRYIQSNFKRGSRYLRSAIFISTRTAIINPKIQDNKFREKYLKKRAQGKHHNSAICSASKNMINVIYSLMKSNESFNYFV